MIWFGLISFFCQKMGVISEINKVGKGLYRRMISINKSIYHIKYLQGGERSHNQIIFLVQDYHEYDNSFSVSKLRSTQNECWTLERLLTELGWGRNMILVQCTVSQSDSPCLPSCTGQRCSTVQSQSHWSRFIVHHQCQELRENSYKWSVITSSPEIQVSGRSREW